MVQSSSGSVGWFPEWETSNKWGRDVRDVVAQGMLPEYPRKSALLAALSKRLTVRIGITLIMNGFVCMCVCVIIHTMYICYEKEILGIDNPSTRKTVSGIIQGYQPIYWLHATSN